MNHYIHTDYKQTVEEYLVVLEVDEGGVGQLPLNIKKEMCTRVGHDVFK